MRELDLQPLSRVPHFDTTLTEDAPAMAAVAKEGIVKCAEAETYSQRDQDGKSDERREGESTEDYLARTCRYCLADSTSGMAELEAALHCDGIWLHAWQYKGASGWSFRSETP